VSTRIDGWCASKFAPVREAFEANFADRGEIGAAVHVIVAGDTVVDLVGGWMDEGRTQPWRHDTVVDVYSVGKAILALLALQLVEEGQLALESAVAEVWPSSPRAARRG
jgi:CubicO group peptidase (beta-lactamase class C family)